MKTIQPLIRSGKSGDWWVDKYEVTPDEAAFSNMRALMHHRMQDLVKPGKYVRLMRGNTVVMSNTPMEMRTCFPILHNGKGRVLINGLGLGLVVIGLLEKPEVNHITVVEKSPDVIRLVLPSLDEIANDRLSVILGDALMFKPSKGVRYDAVWHDIWDNVCDDNYPDMKKLHRKYSRCCDWQDSWELASCRRAK